MRLMYGLMLAGAALMIACGPSLQLETPRHYDRDHIVQEEIQNTHASTALELTENLRPHWLRGRGAKSIRFAEVSYPYVYVNGNRLGGIHTLATLPADNITDMRFLSAGEATILFGMNHPSGAIVIEIF